MSSGNGAQVASKEGYNQAARWTKAAADNLMRLLLALAEFLETQSKYAPYREIARWINEGKGVSFYPVQGACMKEMLYELAKTNIAYFDIKDKNTVLVKQTDFDKVREINRKILIAKSSYYQDVDAKEMEDVIARYDKIKNKELVSVSCRNEMEVEVLKNKCNDISAGFMVGIDTPNEDSVEYRIVVHGDKVLRPNAEKHDFCKAYIQMCMSLYGPNNYVKIQQLRDDEEMDRKISAIKGTEDTVYLVSATDNHSFIAFNKEGFKYYQTSVDEMGQRHDFLLNTCNVDSVDYELELQRCKDRIFNKQLLFSHEELSEHLKTAKQNIDTDRTAKTMEQFQISLMENRISDKIDEMIDKKINENKISFENPLNQFAFYQNECYKIMVALTEYDYNVPSFPDGYYEDDFNYIMNELNENDIDFEEDYEHVMERLENVEVSMHKAQPQNRDLVNKRKQEYDER